MFREVFMNKKILSDDEASVFCLETAEAIRSGISISESFMLIAEQEKGALSDACREVYRLTDAGEELASSMKAQGIFPNHIISMIEVAERTGATEAVFRELSAYYKRQAELKRSVSSAVVYPLILLVIILTVFFVFIIEVLPVFDNVFSQIGATMSSVALVFMNIGLALASAKWVLLGIAVVIAVFVICCFTVAPLKSKVSGFLSGIFYKSKTGRKVLLAQITSALSLAVSGTRDMEEALDLSLKFARGTAFEKPLEDCTEAVRSGERFAEHAEKTKLLEPVYCRMIGIGEKTGSIDTMMIEVANRTQSDMETALTKLVGRVEPTAVIVLSVCVGLLLLSVMLPLVGIMSAL